MTKVALMPAADSQSRRRERAALLALMLGYALLFAVYYPPLFGIEDEVGFVNQALVWSRGAISSEGAGLRDLADFAAARGRHVAQRHPGRSLVALPFLMAAGPRGVFVSGLLLHLPLAWCAAVLLERLGRSPLWAVLLLFHPTLAIYSRTILADAAAGTGLLLAALAVRLARPCRGLGRPGGRPGYFHDKAGRWLETLVVGQRLLQVVLPLWIVSYACVVSAWVATPLRRWLGESAWGILVALVCGGLLAGTGVMFSKHQDHLNELRAIRDITVITIPDGSLVIYDGALLKLFGVPAGLPSYRWRPLRFQGAVMDKMWHIEEERRPWYLAVAPKNPGEALPGAARSLIDTHGMKPVVARPSLTIHVGQPKNDRP